MPRPRDYLTDALGIITFQGAWSDFLWPLIVTNSSGGHVSGGRVTGLAGTSSYLSGRRRESEEILHQAANEALESEAGDP